MKCFGVILAALGVLVVVGTAGASDTGAIPFEQVLTQAVVGLILFGVGVTWTRVADVIEKIKKERNTNK